MQSLTVLGIAGSLRRDSHNRGLLRAAQELAPDGMTIETFDLLAIPPYNLDMEAPLPAPVAALKERIRAANAVLIATPEYNYSVPGVLKNAIDWASRPYGDSAWDGKPVGVMGASPAAVGTARAQHHLRQTLTSLNCYTLNKPEVLIGGTAQKFDSSGNLTDPKSREMIARLLTALAAWTRKLE
jgi:chromate reductase